MSELQGHATVWMDLSQTPLCDRHKSQDNALLHLFVFCYVIFTFIFKKE